MHQENENQLGMGGFGFVHKKMWNGQLIAVKTSINTKKAIKSLRFEINILRDCYHPNIVRYLGVDDESLPNELYMELIEGGNLYEMLKKDQKPLSFSLQLNLSIGIAQGLHYLHNERGIIHMDMKCENILLEYHGEVIIPKICDFGISISSSESQLLTCFQGTYQYTAPELYKRFGAFPFPYSTKSDVYAFAIILWMLTSKHHPYSCTATHSFLRRVKRGEREKIQHGTHTEYAKIITDAWGQDPNHRPSMLTIIEKLTSIAAAQPSHLEPITRRSNQLNSDLYNATRCQDIKRCQRLLELGADPNIIYKPYSSLMMASKLGSRKLCVLLLEYGADPGLQNQEGKTAEEYWPEKKVERNPFARLRLKLYRLSKLDPCLSEDERNVLLTLILHKNPNLLDLDWWLEDRKERWNFIFFAFGYNADKIIKPLTTDNRWPVWSQMTTSLGFTLWHALSTYSNEEFLSLSNYLGAVNINDINNIDRLSALCMAVKKNSINNCAGLIQQGANLDLQDHFGNSALMIAAIKGYANICELLLKQGANSELKNTKDETAEMLWCLRHPLQKNPFALYRRSQALDQTKSQLLEVIKPKTTSIYPTSLYAKIALNDLQERINQATDNQDKPINEIFNEIINVWETKNPYLNTSKYGVLFKKCHDLTDVLKAVRGILKLEPGRAEVNDIDNPSSTRSFLPSIT